MADGGGDGVDSVSNRGPSRAARLVQMFQSNQEEHAQHSEEIEFGQAVHKLQNLSGRQDKKVKVSDVKEALQAVKKALELQEKKMQALHPGDPYTVGQQVDAQKEVYRQLHSAVEPPPEIVDSPEFKELVALLAPPGVMQIYAQGNQFDRQSGLPKHARTEILNRQVSDAVSQADSMATQRMIAKAQQSGGQELPAFAALTLKQMQRELKQRKAKKRKKAKKLEEDEDWEGLEILEAEPLFSPEEAEIMAERAAETMRIIREEIAPEWIPEHQPWMKHAADAEVYGIMLAAMPKELYEETQGFEAMQDLRVGDAVFTLRAQDRLEDAAARKPENLGTPKA